MFHRIIWYTLGSCLSADKMCSKVPAQYWMDYLSIDYHSTARETLIKNHRANLRAGHINLNDEDSVCLYTKDDYHRIYNLRAFCYNSWCFLDSDILHSDWLESRVCVHRHKFLVQEKKLPRMWFALSVKIDFYLREK